MKYLIALLSGTIGLSALAQAPHVRDSTAVCHSLLVKPLSSLVIHHTDPFIPMYTLPRGAVICRMEEAIHKKAKFKVNVGVGGE